MRMIWMMSAAVAALLTTAPVWGEASSASSAVSATAAPAAAADQDHSDNQDQDQDLSGEPTMNPALSAPKDDEAENPAPGAAQGFTGTNPMDNPYQALVEQRQNVQKRWPSDMEAIAEWLTAPATFSIKALTGAGIMKGIAKSMPNMFPEETKPSSTFVSNSKASPAIWEKPERFAELSKSLEDAATGMLNGLQAMDVAAVKAAHGAAQAACDACHAEFVISD